jgi:hypothetical protein
VLRRILLAALVAIAVIISLVALGVAAFLACQFLILLHRMLHLLH